MALDSDTEVRFAADLEKNETKARVADIDLRGKEADKIACGKAHFEALRVREEAAMYVVETTVDEMVDRATATIS